MYNLFSRKGILKVFFGFKKCDIVIDAEEYFMVSTLVSLRTGKINVGYDNILNRRLAYINHMHYASKEHNLMNCVNLLKPLGIKVYRPSDMEPLEYAEKDINKVDDFFEEYKDKKIICLHT